MLPAAVMPETPATCGAGSGLGTSLGRVLAAHGGGAPAQPPFEAGRTLKKAS